MFMAKMTMEEREIHMLKQYSHIYLPYIYTLDNFKILQKSLRKDKEKGQSRENTIFQEKKNQSTFKSN